MWARNDSSSTRDNRWLFEIHIELSSAQQQGEADVTTRPGPSPPGDGTNEQRLKASAREGGRDGREARPLATGVDEPGELPGRLQARLKLIIASWRHDLRADLTWMIRQIESVSSTEWEWQRLRRQMERVDPEFGRHLEEMAVDMSRIERKVSLLMGLGLPAEEIARTLGRTIADIANIESAIAARFSPQTSGVDNATP